MVCNQVKTKSAGPSFGEIETSGDVLHGKSKTVLAHFTQTFRVWAYRPFVEVSIELEPTSDCWKDDSKAALACRWAWPDEKANVLTADGFHLQSSQATRFEALELVELRERNIITDLFMNGHAFHHRSSPRMIDTILITQRESCRRFDFVIGVQLSRPFHAIQDLHWPVGIAKVENGPPKQGGSGWFGRIEESNLLAMSLAPISREKAARIRIVETTGNATHSDIKFCTPPMFGRLTDGRGRPMYDVYLVEDTTSLDFGPFESIHLEVSFD